VWGVQPETVRVAWVDRVGAGCVRVEMVAHDWNVHVCNKGVHCQERNNSRRRDYTMS